VSGSSGTVPVIPDQDDLLDLLRARGEATSVSVRPDRLEFGDFEYRDAVERVGSRWVVSHSGRDGAFELVLSTPDVGYVQRRLADSTVVATRRTLGYPFPWLPVDASGVSPRFALDVDRAADVAVLTDLETRTVVRFGGGGSEAHAVQASWTAGTSWRDLLVIARRRHAARELGVPDGLA
jgi:hypothetical protein